MMRIHIKFHDVSWLSFGVLPHSLPILPSFLRIPPKSFHSCWSAPLPSHSFIPFSIFATPYPTIFWPISLSLVCSLPFFRFPITPKKRLTCFSLHTDVHMLDVEFALVLFSPSRTGCSFVLEVSLQSSNGVFVPLLYYSNDAPLENFLLLQRRDETVQDRQTDRQRERTPSLPFSSFYSFLLRLLPSFLSIVPSYEHTVLGSQSILPSLLLLLSPCFFPAFAEPSWTLRYFFSQ